MLLRGYKDYYYGYTDNNDKEHPGYVDMIDELVTKFPLTDERITGEQNQKEFIVLFGAILRIQIHYKVGKLVDAALFILGIGIFLSIRGRDREACKPLVA